MDVPTFVGLGARVTPKFPTRLVHPNPSTKSTTVAAALGIFAASLTPSLQQTGDPAEPSRILHYTFSLCILDPIILHTRFGTLSETRFESLLGTEASLPLLPATRCRRTEAQPKIGELFSRSRLTLIRLSFNHSIRGRAT